MQIVNSTGSRELQTVERTPLEITDFKRAIQAKNSTLISDISKDQYNELIRRCLFKLGIRENNFPTKEELITILNFLLNNFSDLTVSHVDHAFDLAISGKLNLEANPYENFTCIYVGRVLSAYKIWAAEEALKELKKDNEINPDEENMEEVLVKVYSEWKTDAPFSTFPVSLYFYLESQNKIKLSKEQKHGIKSTVDKLIEKRCADDELYRKNFTHRPDQTQYLQDLYRKYAIGQYFNKCYLNKIQP